MTTTPAAPLRLATLAGAVTLAALLAAGCAGRRAHRAEAIALDAQLNEWSEDVAVRADDQHLYFKVIIEEPGAQGTQESLALWLDADGDTSTGLVMPYPEAAGALGVDLVVMFSPPAEGADARSGVTLFGLESDGRRTDLTHAQVGLNYAPTHTSGQFELRLSRHPDPAVGPAIVAGLGSTEPGTGRAMFTLTDAGGQIIGWSDPETFQLPPAAAAPAPVGAIVPAKEPGAVRVMTYNVRDGAPMDSVSPFSRLFQVIDPDIIVVQEWEGADASNLVAWMTAVVGTGPAGDRQWYARTSSGQGVAIIARHPIEPLGPGRISVEDPSGGDETSPAIRWVGGLVATPVGPVAVSSVQLAGDAPATGDGDRRRLAEAEVINFALKLAMDEAAAPIRVVAGDMNLVGARPPLDALAQGLDADGSPLDTADAFILGDNILDTWSDPTSEFPPARLDYVLYSGSSVDVVQAFVLDTARMSDEALARMGLDRTDTGVSDHLPLVVDLAPRALRSALGLER